MDALYGRIEKMHEDGLYSSLVPLLNIILHQNKTGRYPPFTPSQEYQVLVYYGNALYHMKDYRKAEAVYVEALDLKKSNVTATSGRKKTSTSLATTDGSASETTVRYQIYLCRYHLQEYKTALSILEQIPNQLRTPKILLSMAELYQKEKTDKSLTQILICYKEVLQQDPLALDTIVDLIKEINNCSAHLSSQVTRVSDFMSYFEPKVFETTPGAEWIPSWIEAQMYLYSCKTDKAVECFKQLSNRPELIDSTEIRSCLAQSYYYHGDYKKAISIFKTLYVSDPLMTRGIDGYASCLFRSNENKTLEDLTNRLVARCESIEKSPEPWVALSYYSLMVNKNKDNLDRAYSFAQKANFISPQNLESLLLMGKIKCETNCFCEGLKYLKEAYDMASYRFEVVKTLIECYLSDNKRTQALPIIQHAMKTFGHTPRVLTLIATVQLADSDSKGSNKKVAKGHLETAVKKDRSFLPAVYLLSKIYQDEKAYEKSIDLLLKSIEYESTNKLHRMLADCYLQINDQERFTYHDNIASKLEVSYRVPTEAAQSLNTQSSTSGGVRNSESAMDADANDDDSDADGMEESETDGVWSDNEYS